MGGLGPPLHHRGDGPGRRGRRPPDGAVVDPGHFVLGPLDLEIAWGDRLGLTGANGSGKSTLVGAVLGTRPPVGRRAVAGPERGPRGAGPGPARRSAAAATSVREVGDRCGVDGVRGPLAAGQVRARGRAGDPPGRHAVAGGADPGRAGHLPGARGELPGPRRADQPSRPAGHRAARGGPADVRRHAAARHPRPAHARVGRAQPAPCRSTGSERRPARHGAGWRPGVAAAARWSGADDGRAARPAGRRWPRPRPGRPASTAASGGRRGGLDPTHLAHVLEGGGLDLLGRGRGLETAEDGDVAAHAPDCTSAARTGVPSVRRPRAPGSR